MYGCDIRNFGTFLALFTSVAKLAKDEKNCIHWRESMPPFVAFVTICLSKRNGWEGRLVNSLSVRARFI